MRTAVRPREQSSIEKQDPDDTDLDDIAGTVISCQLVSTGLEPLQGGAKITDDSALCLHSSSTQPA